MSTQTTGHSPALASFIADVTELVSRGGGEQVVTARVAERLTRALAEGLDLDASITAPDPDRYVMYPLYIAPDGSFSIASAVWNVGQATPIHDHGVWGVVGIYSGSERELRYACPTEPGSGPVELLEEQDWNHGEVTVCCTTDQDIHKVTCGSDVPCVGIHVYGGDIGTIRRRGYDPETSGISYFVSTWAQPVAGG